MRGVSRTEPGLRGRAGDKPHASSLQYLVEAGNLEALYCATVTITVWPGINHQVHISEKTSPMDTRAGVRRH